MILRRWLEQEVALLFTEALAYWLALDHHGEDIASFGRPERLCISYSGHRGSRPGTRFVVQGIGWEAPGSEGRIGSSPRSPAHSVDRGEGSAIFFVKAPDEEPKDTAAALAISLQAWEELLKPMSATVRHYWY
jgi:hypothetical protein